MRRRPRWRSAYQCILERQDHLNDPGARAERLPIGSGEIESGHRHALQQRRKLAGGWWAERNMESMLQWRTVRANGWWDIYWANAQN